MSAFKRVVVLWLLILTVFAVFSTAFGAGRNTLAALAALLPAWHAPLIKNHPAALYLIIGFGSCAVTLILVPACRWLALNLDVVDHPGADRKVHKQAVPYLGGLPFYFCFLATMLAVHVLYPQYDLQLSYPMCVAGTFIVLMGLYDDVTDMPSLHKLFIELGLGAFLFFVGFRTTEMGSLSGGSFDLGWLAIIITPLWIAAVINAVNFSDGLDGLAAGLVFICAAAVFAIGLKHQQVSSCIIMACLMGTTLGFLRYNFNPAAIFMGDTGALFLGFVLGVTTLVVRQKGVTIIALAVPMIVLAVPIIDTILSFYRRMRRARAGKFFHPDRDHLHHRLLALGLTQRQVVLSLYFISACMGLMAFIFSMLPAPYNFLMLLLAGLLGISGVIVLRFIEGLSHQSASRSGEHEN